MKKILIGSMIVALAGPVLAVEKGELDQRVRALTSRFEALQAQPGKQIPADVLRKAQGIVLLERTKAGFLFAYQGGGGVALVKNPQNGKWSPTAFLSANEASLGFQVGGEQNFFVILLMSTNATRLLTEPNFEFGGEARGTAANDSAGAEGMVSSPERPILVYDERKGLYGGAAIKGGAIAPDADANRAYYDQFLTMKEILFDEKVKPTDAATKLAAKITEYSRNKEAKQKETR
jgi:lipid-binding SYLF domain-containing protein